MSKWANYSLTVLILTLSSQVDAKKQIELSPPPQKVRAPGSPKIDLKKLRKRNKRQKKHEQGVATPRPVIHSITYRYFLSASFTLPQVTVRSPRSEFSSQPTTHVKSAWRITDREPEWMDMWLGLRIAPFSGTGFFNDVPARYAYTYFGPSFGIGRHYIPQPPKRSRTNRRQVTHQVTRTFPDHGWMLDGGISAVSRKVAMDPSNKIPGKDFETSEGITTDGLGLWFEYTYLDFASPAISSNYSVGVQQNVGKIFIWISVALGGWL